MKDERQRQRRHKEASPIGNLPDVSQNSQTYESQSLRDADSFQRYLLDPENNNCADIPQSICPSLLMPSFLTSLEPQALLKIQKNLEITSQPHGSHEK